MNATSFVALPERFSRLESMLFRPRPAEARRAAERYVGHLLSRPVAPPVMITAPVLPQPALPQPLLPEPAILAQLDV